MIHPQQTHVEHVHEAIPQTANLGAARLAVTERLQVEHALGERRQEVFDLSLVPVAHLPRLDELLGKLEKEVAEFTRAVEGGGDGDDGAVVVAEVDFELLVQAVQQ